MYLVFKYKFSAQLWGEVYVFCVFRGIAASPISLLSMGGA